MTTLARVGFRTLGLLAVWLAGLLGPATAVGHELKEMTIQARVHADRVDLVIVVSPHMAGAILTGTDESRITAINADTFPALRAELEIRAKKICTLTTGEEPARELAPGATDLVLGQENEVEFFLTYPFAINGPLRLKAAVLERIPAGYTASLRVIDAKRNLLAAKVLSREDADVTIPLATSAAGASGN